ncbi:MAG: hypothetical protein JO166_11440 [Deltaproteobacteria bacterium]|nr:hypothetical protein [Deltaproteobacteria bacterium]
MSAEMIKAVAQVITALAWPTVILILLLTHRDSLAEVVRNLESIRVPGGAEIKIRNVVSNEARQIEQGDPEAAKRLTQQQFEAAARVARVAGNTDISVVRRQVQDLAGEYEAIRASLPSGDERTRRMETVVTKMRTLSRAALPLLLELTRSPSPGERLAAIATLQMAPRPDYLSWLAERFRTEKPFIQFHAAVALLSAARVLDHSHASDLKVAIRSAREAIGELKGSDRWNVLDAAERELAT